MFRKILFLIFIFSITTSCKPIFEIGGNSYRFLGSTSLSKLRVMNDSVCSNRGSSKGLFEISRNDITRIIKSNSNSVFMFFLPGCPVLDVSGIKEVYELCKNQKNVNLYMVSKTYEIGSINSLNKKLDNSSAIFILKDSDFSHKIKKANTRLNKLWADYDKGHLIDNDYHNCIIIGNSELKYAHSDIDSNFIASIWSMVY